MKFKVLALLLFAIQGYSQISVGPKHIGRSKEFKKGVIEKFKNTETIFLLPNVYDKSEYEKILKESWNITPYKIVDLENFDLKNYLNDKYSIAELIGIIETSTRGTYLTTSFDIRMYDNEKILKKLNKLSVKKWEKRKEEIFKKNTINIARFYLFPKDHFLYTLATSVKKDIITSLYNENVFFNYNLGLLKNYLQKINNLIKANETYWMYENDYLPELKKLANNKLFIPAYLGIKYDGWKGIDGEQDDENIKEIFKKYDYQYKIISTEELSNKILENQEFYYLRYVRMNSERFLQVVNSKTGEVIYRNYIMGLSYKLKPKNIKKLNKKIKRALKN